MGTEERPNAIEFVVRRGTVNSPVVQSLPYKNTTLWPGSSYTVSNIKKAYGIPEDLQACNASGLQMVWGPGTFGFSQSQLAALKQSQCPLLNMDKVKFDTNNHGEAGGDNYAEGNLDTQM